MQSSRQMHRRRLVDAAVAAALVLLVVIVWCSVHRRWNRAAWDIPLAASSDALSLLAVEKSAAEHYFVPILPKYHPKFGAPAIANWNDFPITEELLIESGGLLSNVIGLFAATNLLVLTGQVLAAVSMFVVCRILRYRREWASVAALAFGLSHYAFQRGLPHLGLTYYWHIPLCLLVCWMAASKQGIRLATRRFVFAIVVAAAAGAQNPYYTNIFVQFLGFSALLQMIRRRDLRRVAPILLIGACAVAVFVAMNFDTLYYRAVHGANNQAAARNYQSVELYALKPLDLFVPPPDHRSGVARKFAFNYLFDEAHKVYIRGEPFAQYIGVVGIAGLLVLGGVVLLRCFSSPAKPLPPVGLQLAWLLLYSCIGGVNGVVGQAGINLFRCTNRYSICVAALALAFLAGWLTRVSRNWPRIASHSVAGVAAAVVLWDQVPPVEAGTTLAAERDRLRSDRLFVASLERALPANAMLFQMPVMAFPESWPINKMGDYEHFRPYLFSHTLRYSYGTDKGRGEDEWQHAAEQLPADQLITTLENAGFAAIYINRAGYADGAKDLIERLNAAGRRDMITSSADDLVCVILHPAAVTQRPERPPEFSEGWYPEEGNNRGDTWHCSGGNAEIVLHNSGTAPRRVRVTFELASYSPRDVDVYLRSSLLYKSPPLTPQRTTASFDIELSQGRTVLDLKTQPPVTFPGNSDTRLLGFILYNLRVQPL